MTFEPEGMDAVRQKYGQLQGVVSTFNEKVGDVLSKAEVQFLQSYRAHMQAVHVEKQELEAKLKEAESQQANDQQVLALERDVEWYRAQKNMLEDQAAGMQKDILYLQEQFEALNKDREFLSSQLKAVKKEQRLHASSEKPGPTKGTTVRTKKDGSGPGKAGKAGTPNEKSPSRRNEGEKGATSAVAARSLVTTGGDGEGSNTPRDMEMVEVRRQIRAKKEQLLKGRAEINRLRSLVVDDKTMRAELEEFFLAAVADHHKEGVRETRHRGGGYMSLEGGEGNNPPGPVPGAVLANGDEERDLTILFDCLFPDVNGTVGKK